MNSIESILESLGYRLRRENNNFWRTRPLYRDSGNPTSLRICRDTGYFWDWSANISGPFRELIRLTIGLDTIDEAKRWLEKKSFSIDINNEKPRLEIPEHFGIEYVESLLPNFDFYTRAGIPESLLRRLRCGIKMDGKQNNRIVFPIFNEYEDKIEGLAGRDLMGRDIKWKLQGKKSNWIYPAFLTKKHIENSNEVVLVESIGDFLKLFSEGFPQVLVLFGVKLSTRMLNWLTVCGAKRIIISTNNDSEKKENVGKMSAEKIRDQLNVFFERDSIEIALPEENDFGMSSKEQINDWAKMHNIQKYEKLSF